LLLWPFGPHGKGGSFVTNNSDEAIRRSSDYRDALLLLTERDAAERRLEEIRELLRGGAAALAVLDTNTRRRLKRKP
jgi:hypothetical protein